MVSLSVSEKRLLQRAIDEITEIAEGFGLDFYPMRYEICPRKLFIRSVHMECQHDLATGALGSNFIK